MEIQEENVREAGAEEGAVEIYFAAFAASWENGPLALRNENVFAFGTVYFDFGNV